MKPIYEIRLPAIITDSQREVIADKTRENIGAHYYVIVISDSNVEKIETRILTPTNE